MCISIRFYYLGEEWADKIFPLFIQYLTSHPNVKTIKIYFDGYYSSIFVCCPRYTRKPWTVICCSEDIILGYPGSFQRVKSYIECV